MNATKMLTLATLMGAACGSSGGGYRGGGGPGENQGSPDLAVGQGGSCLPACLRARELTDCAPSGSCQYESLGGGATRYCFANGVVLAVTTEGMASQAQASRDGAPCWTVESTTVGSMTTYRYLVGGRTIVVFVDPPAWVYRVTCDGRTYEPNLRDAACNAETHAFAKQAGSLAVQACQPGRCAR